MSHHKIKSENMRVNVRIGLAGWLAEVRPDAVDYGGDCILVKQKKGFIARIIITSMRNIPCDTQIPVQFVFDCH